MVDKESEMNCTSYVDTVATEEEATQIDIEDQTCQNNTRSTRNDKHKFTLLDVFKVGQEKMIKQKIHSQRLRKKQRSQWHDRFMLDLYDQILSSSSGINSNIAIINRPSTSSELPLFTIHFRRNKLN